MKRLLTVSVIVIALTISSTPVFGQVCAVTKSGNDVVLLENGSWRDADAGECDRRSSKQSSTTTTVIMGSDSYPAGKGERVIEQGVYIIEAQVVRKGEQPLLVLWHESKGGCTRSYFASRFGEKNTTRSNFFLEDGNVIRFIDRGMKGRRTLKDVEYPDVLQSRNSIFSSGDMCKEYIAYKITDSEIDELKRSDITSIEIKSSSGAELFRIEKNNGTVARQIRALGL